VETDSAFDRKFRGCFFNMDTKLLRVLKFACSVGEESEVFWQRTNFVVDVFTPIDTLRRWGNGCYCHAEERKEGKQFECTLAGRLLGKAYLQAQGTLHELAELRSGANATLFQDGSLHGDAICILSKQMSRLSDRVGYLDRLPYLVARLGEDGMIDRFLSEYDAQLPNGTLHHRVSDAFAHPTQPSLRAHMIAARDAGGAMSATLRDRFLHYFYGMINELPCEGEHRDIQVEQQRSHGVRHPYGIATLRVDQNRVVLTEARKTEAGRALFKKCWAGWKCVCLPPRPGNRISGMLRQTKFVAGMKYKDVCDVVYRLGKHAWVDWSMLKPFFKDSSAPRTNFVESDVDRLVSSYVDACIKQNSFYSLPSDSIDDWCADALLQRPGETRGCERFVFDLFYLKQCFRFFVYRSAVPLDGWRVSGGAARDADLFYASRETPSAKKGAEES
jgi:hypothetical protein